MISEPTASATSSRASAAGLMPFDFQDGPTTSRSGPEAVHASRSAAPGGGVGSPMTAISGLSGKISLQSDALQSCLESRLRARLSGSDLCEVIWKKWVTPWGVVLLRPRARVRTISVIDSGLWPTVHSSSTGAGTEGRDGGMNIQTAAASTWPTTTRDHKDGAFCPNVPVNGLLGRVVWSTIRASDGEKGGPNMQFGAGGQPLPSQTFWATATSHERTHTPRKVHHGEQLANQASAATWNTPTAVEHRRGNQPPRPHDTGIPLTQQIAAIGSSVPMEKRGALNPEFVCWLMSFPIAWVSCGVLVTRSTRARRQRSSHQP